MAARRSTALLLASVLPIGQGVPQLSGVLSRQRRGDPGGGAARIGNRGVDHEVAVGADERPPDALALTERDLGELGLWQA